MIPCRLVGEYQYLGRITSSSCSGYAGDEGISYFRNVSIHTADFIMSSDRIRESRQLSTGLLT